MQILGKNIRIRKLILLALLVVTVALLLFTTLQTPRNDRIWASDQKLLPYADMSDGQITLHNIRNFTYHSRDEYTPNYYNKTFSIDDIESIDYIVEPLANVAAAHTFLSFGLKDGSRIAISVEIRKEEGEEFSPLLGLLNKYELMYVVADERDVLSLRAVYRDNPVYAYPTTATKQQAQLLFLNMLKRINELKAEPEFYHTITNSCATNIADHINNITPGRVGWDPRLVLPKNSDILAYELGLIDNSVPLEELRKRYQINEAIKKYDGNEQFSILIRADREPTND